MMKETLDRYRTWQGTEHQDTTFRLECALSPPASQDEIESLRRSIPLDMADVWRECREATLFEDVEYGQWGLHLLPPSMSAARTLEEVASRPDDFNDHDLAVGEFLGDLELLVLAQRGERYEVCIALPLDPRPDWDIAAATMSEFLVRYFDAHGEKYWEAFGQIQS